MVAFPNIRAGDILFDSRWKRCDDGKRRHLTWVIKVVQVDHLAGTAVIQVDGGIPREVRSLFFASLRREPVKKGGHEAPSAAEE